MAKSNPPDLLRIALKTASGHLREPIVENAEIVERVELASRTVQSRACARFLLACLLAKVHNPKIDIRKPYTEIGGKDSYSGRSYDESFVSPFVTEYNLPCNSTTAFLTPAFRNKNIVLSNKVKLEGRPPQVYQSTLQLLTDVENGLVSASDLLAETVRSLLVLRDERQKRMKSLLAEMAKQPKDKIPLSAEAIVTLIQQHLSSPNASRLPVLVVAAAYTAAQKNLGERVLPLESHNAADKQTGSLGDLEITLVNDENVITSYEMKAKRVIQGDIDHAIQKIAGAAGHVDHYVFITTDTIDREIKDYAATMYEKTGGTEVVVLDCIGFLRHFLHLFHRIRLQFLDSYQKLVLAEPNSSVRQELKEAFLVLRKAAESA